MEGMKFSRFTSELRVRPDDIDMFNHVHNSIYFDYVLAARYEQMEKHYGMPMEAFLQQGYGWVVKTAHIDYKRPLILGDHFLVTTGIVSITETGCRVTFEINNKNTGKLCCDGWFDYVMIDLKTSRSTTITEDIIRKYAI